MKIAQAARDVQIDEQDRGKEEKTTIKKQYYKKDSKKNSCL